MTIEEFTTLTGLPADAYNEDEFEFIEALRKHCFNHRSKNEFCDWFMKMGDAKNQSMFSHLMKLAAIVVMRTKDMNLWRSRELELEEKVRVLLAKNKALKEDLTAAKKKEDETYAKAFNEATDIVMRERDYYLNKAAANIITPSAIGDDATLAIALHKVAFMLYQHRDLHPLDRVREELYGAVDAAEAAEK